MIHQDRCAMKVCTDSCIFGAYVPVDQARTVLDIGTGTGLLALMIAQRQPEATIDALEIEEDAYQQALENFKDSPWKQRIRGIHQSVQAFRPEATEKRYDYIICNPPFYRKHLRSPSEKRSLAMHGGELSLEDLVEAIERLLHASGTWAILLPPHESTLMATLAQERGYSPQQKLYLKNYAHTPIFRVISVYTSQNTPEITKEETLIIRDAEGQYSSALRALLKGFYLIF